MVDKRADAAAAYAKAPKPPQAPGPGAADAEADVADAGQAPTAAGQAPAAAGQAQPQDRPDGPQPQPRDLPDPEQAVTVETKHDADGDGGEAVEHDLDELAARAQMADEYLVLAQRTQADFENYRKRASRDAALAQERGVARLAKELLPAIDNLDRAVQAAAESESQILDGVKLVHADLLAALARVGIEPFSPAGEAFNPQMHEAVAQHQVEGVEAGTVLEVFQQGYRQGETVLRPARVLVAA